MEFDLVLFEKWAAWFLNFCRRMEKSNLPAMPRDDHDGLLSVNLHIQKALKELKDKELETTKPTLTLVTDGDRLNQLFVSPKMNMELKEIILDDELPDAESQVAQARLEEIRASHHRLI